jgi:hypothetical protein
LYTSPDIGRTIKTKEGEMSGECTTNGSDENAYKILVKKPEGKRHRRRREDNIRKVKVNLSL